MKTRAALLPSLILLLGVLAGPASAQSSFAQLEGRDGCVRAFGAITFDFGGDVLSGCSTANGLGNPKALVLTPDQKQVLVAAGGGDEGSNAIVVLNRDTDTGALAYASCTSNDGGDGRLGSDGACTDGDGLSGLDAIAITPDGKTVFATSRTSSSLTWFDRDPATGALTQAGCLKSFAWPGERCTTAPLLGQASGVAVSPDGKLVFVTAAVSGSLTVYRRDPATGAIERAACVSDTGSDGLCADVAGLRGASDVVATPDGTGVYVTAPRVGAVTGYDVDPATGTLTQRICLAELVAENGRCTAVSTLAGATSAILSADGQDLYVGATEDEALTAFRRQADGGLANNGCFVYQEPQPGDEVDEDVSEDEDFSDEDAEGARASQDESDDSGTGDCTPTRALDPRELTVAADGRSLFAAGDDYLAAFRRDAATGKLEFAACAEEQLSYKTCVPARGLPGGSAMATSDDGRSLYVASNETSSIAVFSASLAVASRAVVRASGRARVRVDCPAARALPCFGRLRHALIRGAGARYRLRPGAHATLTVRLRAHVASRVRTRHLRGLTITSTDATGLTAPARRHIALRWR